MDKLDKIKQIVQEWLDKQGHDRCWYYPELFNKLAEVLDIKQRAPSCLPPRSEFMVGCHKYQDEQYGT